MKWNLARFAGQVTSRDSNVFGKVSLRLFPGILQVPPYFGTDFQVRNAVSKMIDDAENRVNGILNEANTQADQRRKGADNYVREVLFALEERVADTLGQVRGGIDLLDARPAVNVAD